jgi:hypothetical protein
VLNCLASSLETIAVCSILSCPSLAATEVTAPWKGRANIASTVLEDELIQVPRSLTRAVDTYSSVSMSSEYIGSANTRSSASNHNVGAVGRFIDKDDISISIL